MSETKRRRLSFLGVLRTTQRKLGARIANYRFRQQLVGVLWPNVYQGGENPHASVCSRFYIASILDARASGADAHPDVARGVWAMHSPRRYGAFIGCSVSGRSNAASTSGFAHTRMAGFSHAFQAFKSEHC